MKNMKIGTSRYSNSISPGFSKIHEDKELAYIVPANLQSVIGIVGLRGSGKSIISKFLIEEENYRYYSLSHIVRKELLKLALERNSANQQKIASKFRERYSQKNNKDQYGYLAKETIRQIRSYAIIDKDIKNIIIEGIEHLDEIKVLIKMKNFFLIGIDACPETRFARLKKEGARSPELNWNQFLEDNKRELGGDPSPYAQNINKCLEEVKIMERNNKGYLLDNNLIKRVNGEKRDKSISEIHLEIKQVIEEIKRKAINF